MQKLELRAHLIELRNRFMIVALFVVVGSVLAIIFQTEVMAALLRPMEGESLIYTSPYGGFEFIFKVILFLGFIFAIPAALYQTFKFIAPALPEKIDGLGTKIIIISSLLAIAGVTFAYFIAIPASLQFLNSIGGDFLDSFISTNEYLSFFMVYMLGFAIIFQLPLIMSIIDKNHPLQPKTLIRKQKYIIAGSYLVAALMTPTPDAMNQTIMALPIVALYQVGIGVIWTQRKAAGTSDSVTEAETNWYTARPMQQESQADSIIDLEEEKNRYGSPRKQRKPRRLVSDMVSVPVQNLPLAGQPQHNQVTVSQTLQPTQHHYSQPEPKKVTKLPLTYDQHSAAQRSIEQRQIKASAAQTMSGFVSQPKHTAQPKPIVKLDTIKKARQDDRNTRSSYINTMIKTRAQPLLQG